MKHKTLALIHTSATLVPVFADLCARYLPAVKTFNIVDDSLIKNTIAMGMLTPDTARRVVNYADSAQNAGADIILYTCSSIGAAVEMAATLSRIPVIRVDQPMADMAVSTGTRIGIIATLSTTLEPTADLIRRRAIALGRTVALIPRLCEGAFEALMSGDTTTHDERVKTALLALSQESDVMVLAQASMARVVESLTPADRRVPILASPPIAIQYLASILA